MGVCVPEEYGGAGADFLSYILVLEELSRADAGVGVTVAVHTSACTLPILQFGTDEQRARFVPPLARGERDRLLRADRVRLGLRRGRARHAAPNRSTAAGRSRGAKQWITNAAFGGTLLLFARTDAETRSARGVSAFIVDTDAGRRHAHGGEARAQLVGDERHRHRYGRRADRLVGELQPRLPDRDGDARRRPHRDRGAGGRDRAGRVRRRAAATPRSARRSASRSPSSRRSSTSSRTCRWRSTRRGCSPTGPPG